MDLSQILELLSQGYDVAVGLLAGVGALKILARYTPWKWDDKVLAIVEKPLSLLRDLLGRSRK
jgi:hypothetical protein